MRKYLLLVLINFPARPGFISGYHQVSEPNVNPTSQQSGSRYRAGRVTVPTPPSQRYNRSTISRSGQSCLNAHDVDIAYHACQGVTTSQSYGFAQLRIPIALIDGLLTSDLVVTSVTTVKVQINISQHEQGSCLLRFGLISQRVNAAVVF